MRRGRGRRRRRARARRAALITTRRAASTGGAACGSRVGWRGSWPASRRRWARASRQAFWRSESGALPSYHP
eukprot:scaffold126500_cov42-Phaeocystis_antarctica.AAC.3